MEYIYIPPLTNYNCPQSLNTSFRASFVVHVIGMKPHNWEEEHSNGLVVDPQQNMVAAQGNSEHIVKPMIENDDNSMTMKK